MSTKIEWTEATWNPVTGCTKISSGCRNCYAERMANRLKGRYGYDQDDPFRVTVHYDRIRQPLDWKKPRRVFVCSMADIFHKDIPQNVRNDIFSVMVKAKHHTFQVLTKRIEDIVWPVSSEPLPSNIWVGVTVESQGCIERLRRLLKFPAQTRFVSFEPLLGRVNVSTELLSQIDWVIAGAETGPGKRPMALDWARKLRNQCREAGVPFFFKKDSEGSRLLDGELCEGYPR